jgi:hypothetical protein
MCALKSRPLIYSVTSMFLCMASTVTPIWVIFQAPPTWTPATTLDGLPLFATDEQLAIAIVGRERASFWLKTRLSALRGFPHKNEAHGGWPVPLVKKF